MADNPFEIPQALRDFSEQNVKQAHAAYEQLVEFMTKAMGAWMGALPANPIAAGFQHMQDRAMKIAMENAEAAFTFGGKISNAETPQEILLLQTQFAQERVKAFVTQTQQLYSVIAEAFQKSERSAAGASMGAMPSNLMAASFKHVQDRAVAMVKTNAETAVALGEKITKIQNFQELLTLQAHFAQDQMQAFATQTQELYKLIQETVQKLEPQGAEMSAMPPHLMTADFKDVQSRAMNVAMEFSDSAFAFAGKISHAQSFQDIVTLQTQFAQDRMQAFATQTQELYKLIEETVQKMQRG